MRPDTLTRALARASETPGTGLRFLDRRERPTFHEWSEIHRRATDVAHRLVESGLQPGERVAIIYPTAIEFFEAFFGTLLAGGCPCPMYPPVRLGRLGEYHQRTAAMLTACDARVVLASPNVRRILGETMELANAARLEGVLECLTLDDLPDASSTRLPTIEATHLGLVQFSSGTTGDPSPVALSHRALQAQSQAIESFMPDTEEVTNAGVSWLPLYHDMGLVGCVLPALNRPGVLTLIGPEVFVAHPGVWLRAMSAYGGTVSPAPNFAYALCVERISDEELEGVDLSAWRLALNGAEPVAPSVLRAFSERFSDWGLRPAALTPVYGLSEAALAVTFSEIDRPFSTVRLDADELATGVVHHVDTGGIELATVGVPLPGFAVEIRSESGDVLGEESIGEVWVSGPSLMDGYLGLPDKTGQVLRDGWLDTGDLGFTTRGQLVLSGRSKDILIVRGRKYPPHAVEHAVDDLDGVRRGCAAAVSYLGDGSDGETLALLVEYRADADPSEMAALPAACQHAVFEATGLALDHVELLEPGTLPRTSSGKIRRRVALELHRLGELQPPDSVNLVRIGRSFARSKIAYGRITRNERRRRP